MKREDINDITNVIKEKYGEDTKVVVSTGKYYPKDIPDFVMLFQAITEQFITSLQPSSAKILLYMLCKLKYSNHIGVDQKTMAEECKMSIRSVNMAIKQLLECKIILSYSDTQDKRRNIYIINPYNAWKGTFKERKKVIKGIDANQTILALNI